MDYVLLSEKEIPNCCGACYFIRYKTGKPTCKLLKEEEICIFGYCNH